MANDLGPLLLGLSYALLGMSAIVILLRLGVRYFRVHKVRFDDYLMGVALLNEIVRVALVHDAVYWGLGRHASSLTGLELEKAVRMIITFEATAVMTCTFGRISFAITLLLIISNNVAHKHIRVILWLTIAQQVIINVITLVQIYTQCGTHLNALWNPELDPTVLCQSPHVETYMGYVQSAFNSVCDLTLASLPYFLLRDVQIPRAQRNWTIGLMSLGVAAFISSVVKAVEIEQLSAQQDFTWYMTKLQICVSFENNLVMTTASIPALRAFRTNKRKNTSISGNGTHDGPTTGHMRSINRDPPPPVNPKQGRAIRIQENGSEEYILSPIPLGAIEKKTEVDISFDKQSGMGRSERSEDYSTMEQEIPHAM